MSRCVIASWVLRLCVKFLISFLKILPAASIVRTLVAYHGLVVKLADTTDLGSVAARRVGSSPSGPIRPFPLKTTDQHGFFERNFNPNLLHVFL